MTSPSDSSWPDPARVVPPPEFDKHGSFHWLKRESATNPYQIFSLQKTSLGSIRWSNYAGSFKSEHAASLGWSYAGPCLPPDPRDTELTTLRAEVDRLRMRERVCDSQCGASQHDANEWYRAEGEFSLPQDTPYEAIKALRALLRRIVDGVTFDTTNIQTGGTYIITSDADHALTEARAALAPPEEK